MAALFFFQMLILLKTCSCFSYVIISTSPDGSGQVCLAPLLWKRDCSNSQQERETGIFLQCFGTLAVLWNYVGRNALYVFLENVFHSMIRGIHVAFILKDIICCSFFWSFFFFQLTPCLVLRLLCSCFTLGAAWYIIIHGRVWSALKNKNQRWIQPSSRWLQEYKDLSECSNTQYQVDIWHGKFSISMKPFWWKHLAGKFLGH